jgi:hypothetical protein
MKRKCLAIGIILLFVGTCIIPSTGDFTVSNGIKNDDLSICDAHDSPPDEEWNRTYYIPSKFYSCGNCVQVTPDGGYIVTGSAGYGYSYSVYLLKVDSQGNELWNRTFGCDLYDEGRWVEVTSDNGYIITGNIGDYPANIIDVWLIKTDANGNEEWNRTFGLGQASGFCVKQTKDGGYILTGGDAGSLLLIKTNAFGNELWNKTYYGNSSEGHSLALTTDGGYIVTGKISYHNTILMKTDKNGTVEWEKEFNSCLGREVQQTSDGGYIVGGQTYNNSMQVDLLLMKTDEDGTEQWNRTFGGSEDDWGYTVIETVDGDYILGGTQLGLQGHVTDKFWLIRTHPDGSVVWDHLYLPSLSARCYCVQQTPDNGFIAIGVIDSQPNPKCVILKLNSGNNHPPSSSIIEGSYWGVINEDYLFCINVTDTDGDDIYCIWNWGDGNYSNWLGPYSSNGTICASHSWSQKGTYGIRVKLKDVYGQESGWSDPFVFTVYELKKAFLFGRYTNMTSDEEFITVHAVNLWMISCKPFQFHHYIAGETITYSENTIKALVTPRSLIGLFDVVT